MAERKRLLICTDGGARGNPGPAACAAVVKTADDGTTVMERGRYLGETTNNVAEYEAVLLGLEMAAQLKADDVEIRSDSELMVRQLTGQYKVRNDRLRALHARVLAALQPFDHVDIRHVRREKNAEADALVNQAIDEHVKKRPPAGSKSSDASGRKGSFRLK